MTKYKEKGTDQYKSNGNQHRKDMISVHQRSSLREDKIMERHKNSSDAGAEEDSGSMGAFQGEASPGWHSSFTAPEQDQTHAT